jgi:signal transduction histidine kinase/CheY-like chemotaxis protein
MPSLLNRFRDLPIQRKLIVLGWTTSVSALVVSTIIFLASAYVLERRSYQGGVETLAAIVADNLTASASFDDSNTAAETLHALQGTPTIHLACAYGSSGSLLAEMASGTIRRCAVLPPPDQHHVSRTTVVVSRPIVLDDRRVGTLYVEGNLVRLDQQLQMQGVAAVLGAIGGLLIATMIAAGLRRQIVAPITSLSKVSAEISRDGNYAVRAKKEGNDEVGALVDAFNHLVDRVALREDELRLANRQKDDFLAALSHELRTPLNAIVGWLQILAANSADPEVVRQALVRLDRNAKAQVRLIEDLLDISRIISGKLELKLSTVDLVGIVHAAIDVARPSAEGKGLQLSSDLLASPAPVSGDPDRLQQVIVNLLANAVKFTPAGGRIEVTLEESDSTYVVSVHDTGIGISPDFLPHVFDRFRQADGSITRQHGGLGLGLSIARDLVAMHHGRLEASSAGPGSGATFTVVLPGLPADAVPSWDRSPDARVRLDGLTVLVVDDDADAREVARQALEPAGARVTVAASAAEALSALTRESIDVFICDIQMPDLDGCTLLRVIRGDRHTMPAVAVTAHAGLAEQDRMREAGYGRIITKPYPFTELVETVSVAVASQASKGTEGGPSGPPNAGPEKARPACRTDKRQ